MSNSDNPLIRFVAFWWALGVFSLFAVILIALKIFGAGGDPEQNDLEAAAAAKRYEAAAKVKGAQEANLAYKEVEAGKVVQVHPHDAFAVVGKELVSKKAAAVENPAQIVPGGPRTPSPDAPSADFGAVDKLSPAADAPIDPAAMAAGQATYMICSACHGPAGQGTPMVGPPLAGSEWVTGPVSNLIRIQLRGLTGPIHVKGQELTFAAPMVPVIAGMDDATIANALTYIRNSFGNKAGPVLPEQVKMLRSETGKPPLTEADLIKP